MIRKKLIFLLCLTSFFGVELSAASPIYQCPLDFQCASYDQFCQGFCASKKLLANTVLNMKLLANSNSSIETKNALFSQLASQTEQSAGLINSASSTSIAGLIAVVTVVWGLWL